MWDVFYKGMNCSLFNKCGKFVEQQLDRNLPLSDFVNDLAKIKCDFKSSVDNNHNKNKFKKFKNKSSESRSGSSKSESSKSESSENKTESSVSESKSKNNSENLICFNCDETGHGTKTAPQKTNIQKIIFQLST